MQKAQAVRLGFGLLCVLLVQTAYMPKEKQK